MTETIGTTTYTRQRRTVLVAQPRWTPPAMPCGAWLPVRPLDKPPETLRLVNLVRRNGTTAIGAYVNGWEVSRDGYSTRADTAEFIGWRGML